MAKVGRDAMGPAIGDFVSSVVGALGDERLGIKRTASVGFEFAHHGFEKILDVVCGEHSIGLNGRWDVWVAVLVCDEWFLFLVERHLIDKLFQFFVNDVGDRGDIVGGVAGSLTGELIFHSVFVFCCHVGAEEKIGFVGRWLGSPDFESVVEKSSVIDVFVAETEELRIGDGFIAISGKFLAVTELKIKVFNRSWRIPLSCHLSVVGG